MNNQSGFLEWDSHFFCIDVGFIEATNENQIKSDLSNLMTAGYQLVYVYSQRPLQLEGFDSILVDKKRSYVLSNPTHKDLSNKNCIIQDSPELLYDLAYQAGEHSRFKVDPHISDKDFKRLYRTWIDNSINCGFADIVLGAVENGKPIGFITAKKRQQELSIGLFATDVQYRGKGIGSILIQHIINLAANDKMSVEVTTQSDNATACKFYENRGFKLLKEDLIYHVWNTHTNRR